MERINYVFGNKLTTMIHAWIIISKEFNMSNELTASVDNIVEKARDYFFDNMRAILIILVVWGHVLDDTPKNDFAQSIYYFLFFFHMPALTFISGYFSKNLEKIRNTAFVKLLLPYLILNVCDYIYKTRILHLDYDGLRFFRPFWGLWYLLALFLWKFFLKDIVRIRFVLPLSFLFALFSGYSREFSEYLALSRVICFLPFFLLGYYCTHENIEKIKKIPKLLSIGIMAAGYGVAFLIVKYDIFKKEILYLRKPYPQESETEGLLLRLFVYVIAIVLTVAVINLVGSKKSILTSIGTSTMTIYIMHVYTIPALEKLNILDDHPYYYFIYSIIMTVLITYIYSRPIVIKCYNTLMNWVIKIILKPKQGKTLVHMLKINQKDKTIIY